MRAIYHDAHAFERHAAGERGFGVFDIPSQGILDTHGLANVLSSGTDVFDLAAENKVLDLIFDLIVQFITVRAEKLDSIVVVRIVRGSDNDSGVRTEAASDIRHARRWQWPDKKHVHPHGKNSRRKRVLQHVPGETRVFAEHNFMPAPAARLHLKIFENVPGSAAQLERR